MINPGDKVSWTHVSTSRRTLSMQLREGIVEAVQDGLVTVKKASGKREVVELPRLRVEGQPSQITEFVEAMVNREGE